MMEKHFRTSLYKGIYCDDKISILYLIQWLQRFQAAVIKLIGGVFFQFTMEIWNPLDHQQEQQNTSALNRKDNDVE
eukprot:15367055-Ditylum_brightwellii.AAC.1